MILRLTPFHDTLNDVLPLSALRHKCWQDISYTSANPEPMGIVAELAFVSPQSRQYSTALLRCCPKFSPGRVQTTCAWEKNRRFFFPRRRSLWQKNKINTIGVAWRSATLRCCVADLCSQPSTSTALSLLSLLSLLPLPLFLLSLEFDNNGQLNYENTRDPFLFCSQSPCSLCRASLCFDSLFHSPIHPSLFIW